MPEVIGPLKRFQINLRMTPKFKRQLMRAARQAKVSASEYIRRAVQEKIEREAGGQDKVAGGSLS